jgi:hypothetical protein
MTYKLLYKLTRVWRWLWDLGTGHVRVHARRRAEALGAGMRCWPGAIDKRPGAAEKNPPNIVFGGGWEVFCAGRCTAATLRQNRVHRPIALSTLCPGALRGY